MVGGGVAGSVSFKMVLRVCQGALQLIKQMTTAMLSNHLHRLDMLNLLNGNATSCLDSAIVIRSLS